MIKEKRKYRRVAANIRVLFSKEPLDSDAQEYLEGVADNCSIGGMFISTRHLFRKRTIVKLKFEIDYNTDTPTTLRARSIVRWIRRWGKARGMGLEFIEIEGMGKHSFNDWAKRLFQKQQDGD